MHMGVIPNDGYPASAGRRAPHVYGGDPIPCQHISDR